MASTTEIVKLNIGGTIFQTTKSTLTRYDGFFKTMLETNVPITKDDTGAIFIDRSPKHFDLILNFMRDGDVALPSCEREIKEISKEAQYYLLNELVELCLNPFQVMPITETFKILHSDIEVFHAVLHSKKPVAIILLPSGSGWLERNSVDDWKQFIERYSLKWNIFIGGFNQRTYQEKEIHYNLEFHNGKKTIKCATTNIGCNICRLPQTTLLKHLEHHLNEFL